MFKRSRIRRLALAWLLFLLAIPVAHAEVSWLFPQYPAGSMPPGWEKPALSFPTESWSVAGGRLVPMHGPNTYAVIQSPALRFVNTSAGAGQSADGASDESSSGRGASDPTATFHIDDLSADATGPNDTFLMELIRLDQASLIVHSFLEITSFSDISNYRGSYSVELTSPEIELGGTYAVRFTAYDYDGEYTVSVDLLNLRISNAILADAPLLPGDFNGNGAVENADLTLLLNHWGNAVPPTPAGWIGSPLTAPTIDNDELTALLNNWGTSLPGGAALSHAAVPEPASLAMLGIGLAMLGHLRRRRPIRQYAPRRNPWSCRCYARSSTKSNGRLRPQR